MFNTTSQYCKLSSSSISNVIVEQKYLFKLNIVENLINTNIVIVNILLS